MKQIYHPWTKWECVSGGMYETTPPSPLSADEAREQYRMFLVDLSRFEASLKRVLNEWPISCEQFLSNENINRIAWLGQSSMCIDTGIPACFRGGFRLLERHEQIAANMTALKSLNIWLRSKGEENIVESLQLIDDHIDTESSVIPLSNIDNSTSTINRIGHYINTWKRCGYPSDIPDEVPNELMRTLLAPSYKAICFAILKNDMPLKSLGFIPKQSKYYSMLKRIEIEARPIEQEPELRQLKLF